MLGVRPLRERARVNLAVPSSMERVSGAPGCHVAVLPAMLFGDA
jgi:hypothetical protein